MIKQYQDSSSVPLHLLFIITVAMTILTAFVLAFFYSKFPHAPPLDPSILIPKARGGLLPKPQEQFVFLILALVVPTVTFLTSLFVFKGINTLSSETRRPAACPRDPEIFLNAHAYCTERDRTGSREQVAGRRSFNYLREILMQNITGTLIFTTVALLYFPFIGYDFSQVLVTDVRLPSEHPVLILMLTLFGAGVWYIWQPSRVIRKTNRFYNAIGWIIFALAVVLQTGSWRILSEMSITTDARWHGHADAVFYAVSQVMAGKTLLIDLPSQYGLYPELIRPIFKLLGFSIFNFIAFCAVLQVISLASIYWVVDRVVHSQMIKITFGIALVMVTFETILFLIGLNEPYFQYWPIRFFWPAIAVLAFYRYTIQPTTGRAAQLSLIGSVGTLWNMDSGLMIVVAFAGVLVLKWIVCKTERLRLGKALIVHFLILIPAVALMLGYLSLKGGGPIHWEWLFGYQKLFYGLGFMMMPMPLHPYPWMSVLGIYLIALIVAVRSWVFNPKAKNADLLTFISMLGLGLFVYYEGRSHPLNLITVCWPAIVLIAILADRVLRAIRTGLLSRQHLMFPIAALSVLLFCSIPFLLLTPKMANKTVTAYQNRNIPANEWVSDELNFIRSHSKPGNDCVILSLRQGLYYSAAGLGSPISGPGYIEMLLLSDREAFIDKLAHQRFTCIFIGKNHPLNIAEYWYPIVAKFAPANVIQTWIKAGDGSTSGLALDVDPMEILQGYEISARSSLGSMVYLQPKG